MRIICFVPLIAALGCAHQASGARAEAAQPAAAAATEAPAPQAAVAPSPTLTAKGQPAALACAPVKVHFALDSDQLYDSEKPILDRTASCLRLNSEQRITIVGNADERGPTEYNQDLGQRRAETVARYLEDKGASPAQVEAVVSHGEESPLCRESTLTCWQLNRRTAVRESCHL